FRRRAPSKSRASLLRRFGSSTVARFVLIFSGPCFLSGNCMFSPKLLIFVIWEGGRISSPAPSVCKLLAIRRKRPNSPLLIVLDAPSPPHVRPVRIPTAPARAIVCSLRELFLSV